MNRGGGRKEDEVHRLMDFPHPSVPVDLVLRATERGTRLIRRRRIARRLFWAVLVTATIGFLVWLSVADPWAAPPSLTTPPLQDG